MRKLNFQKCFSGKVDLQRCNLLSFDGRIDEHQLDMTRIFCTSQAKPFSLGKFKSSVAIYFCVVLLERFFFLLSSLLQVWKKEKHCWYISSFVRDVDAFSTTILFPFHHLSLFLFITFFIIIFWFIINNLIKVKRKRRELLYYLR